MPADAARLDADLEHYRRLMLRALADPGVGRRAIGVAAWDAALWRLGRDWLPTLGLDWTPRPDAAGPDVYVASRLYDEGGHTALIGDFVDALDGADASGPAGRRSHLLLTGVVEQTPWPLAPAARCRVRLPADRVERLAGPSLGERAAQLVTRLNALRPRRLFLFHHPDDPLPGVCAQPETAAARVLVHHADSSPAFGLHLPGVCVIDLSESAASLSRLLGVPSARLALTAPDPGVRPHGFRRHAALVTASSGSAHKFLGPYAPGYPEAVARILAETGGTHVHIGPLHAAQLDAVTRAVSRQAPHGRFEHVPHVPSLARALWERDVDAYVASFPADGARSRVEVLASGTPYLRHSLTPLAPDAKAGPGDLAWYRLDELTASLRALTDAGALEAASALVRAEYDRTHHPDVFAARLREILATGHAPAALSIDRRLRSLESLARSQVASLLPVDPSPPAAADDVARLRAALEDARADGRESLARLAALGNEVAELRAEHASQLQALRAEQAEALRALAGERARWERGATWRQRLRRWLLREP